MSASDNLDSRGHHPVIHHFQKTKHGNPKAAKHCIRKS